MKLNGKVALVTGAIKGIGLSIALELSKMGVNCVLTYYDWLESLDEMKRQMDASGTPYVAVSSDLTRQDEVEKVVKTATDVFGRLDILINNIERGGWPVVHGPYTRHQWELEFHTTVTSKWYLFNASLPYLKDSGEGVVVNISSISGLVGRSGPAALVFNDCYSLCNRGIQTLTEIWAREGAPEVRVNELMLGIIETRHGPGTRGWGLLSEQQRQAICDHTLLGRTGQIEEVVKAVRFLVQDATFMTGAVIRMDGGYVLGADRPAPMPKGVVQPDEPSFGGSILPRP